MATEVMARPLPECNVLPDLSSIVTSECARRQVPYEPQTPLLQPTEEEARRILNKSFPPELDFSVPINLTDSKRAFLQFLQGLGEKDDFEGMWLLRDHDPHSYPNPIGKVDLAFMVKVDELQTE